MTVVAFVFRVLALSTLLASGACADSLTAPVVGFEYAVYYASAPQADPVQRLPAWLAGTPGAPRLAGSLPGALADAVVAARLDRDAQKDYAPPDAALVQRFAHGLSRAQAQALPHAQAALVLDFAHPGARAMPALRAAQALVERVARDTGGLVWDEQTREVFTPDAWHERRVTSWSGDLPDTSLQTVVHAYDHGQSLRAISLGMAAMGLPDLVVQDFSGTLIQPVGHLLALVAQSLAEGLAPGRGGDLDVDLRAVRHPAVAAARAGALRTGPAIAKLILRPGIPEEGDPRNRLLALSFDRYPGNDAGARQDAMGRALFNVRDDAQRVRHDAELLAASETARRQLPALREAFRRGLLPGETIQVKAPFATDDGGTEWMWLEVTRWDGDAIEGMLRNEPDRVRGLHSGQAVKASQAKVFDYLRRLPDGRTEGDTTDPIIDRMSAGR